MAFIATSPARGGLSIAAPSCVLPAHIAENAHFLQYHVQECGLCFFETEACLAYSSREFPLDLAELPLTWHVHLPLDLDWRNVQRTADICLRLCAKVGHLRPRLAVLHPPEAETVREKRNLLVRFAQYWHAGGGLPLLLENVAGCDILELGDDFCTTSRFGFCLDLGHALSYAQTRLLGSRLPREAALVHWSAPLHGDSHGPLNHLTAPQLKLAGHLMREIPSSATHMLEIFNWSGIRESMPILAQLHHQARHVQPDAPADATHHAINPCSYLWQGSFMLKDKK